MNLTRRRSGFMRSPPGPRYKSRELMSEGVLHKTGTTRGTCLAFFVFSSAPGKDNENRSARVTAISLTADSRHHVCPDISISPFNEYATRLLSTKGDLTELTGNPGRESWRGN